MWSSFRSCWRPVAHLPRGHEGVAPLSQEWQLCVVRCDPQNTWSCIALAFILTSGKLLILGTGWEISGSLQKPFPTKLLLLLSRWLLMYVRSSMVELQGCTHMVVEENSPLIILCLIANAACIPGRWTVSVNGGWLKMESFLWPEWMTNSFKNVSVKQETNCSRSSQGHLCQSLGNEICFQQENRSPNRQWRRSNTTQGRGSGVSVRARPRACLIT